MQQRSEIISVRSHILQMVGRIRAVRPPNGGWINPQIPRMPRQNAILSSVCQINKRALCLAKMAQNEHDSRTLQRMAQRLLCRKLISAGRCGWGGRTGLLDFLTDQMG